ncbi:MAG: hypothetical protein DRP75_03415 [Candidatus Omnitrophota bacterium]|nr:MAG: hypothetical protein DRP75_03415 [Candidatus Omnitrophota bacterium]
MRRIGFIFLLVIAGIIVVWGARDLGRKRETYPVSKSEEKQTEQVEEKKKIEKEAEILFKKAEEYFQKGQWKEAGASYKKILADWPESPIARKAEERLGEVNLKLLFSPSYTEGSKIYEVKSGDSLFSIAKKFGVTVDLIKRSNALESDSIYPGQRLKIPTLKFSILIDKSDNTLILEGDGKMIKKYSVSTGKNNSTPVGEFKIVSKLVNPVWYYQGKAIPPGDSRNVLGSRWLGLSIKGCGIHGTTDPDTVGKQITRGCIRMLNKDVEELYAIVPIGTRVVIQD